MKLSGNLNDIVNHAEAFLVHEARYTYKEIVAAIQCKDGTLISVQASHGSYCDPEDDFGPYTTVEVMPVYPNTKIPRSWRKYKSGSLYGHVPVEIVQRFINRHSGEVDD